MVLVEPEEELEIDEDGPLIDEDSEDVDQCHQWLVYRFSLEPCTWENGILSDNRFHPDKPAWFAHPRNDRPQDTTHFYDLANTSGYSEDDLVVWFTSLDPVERLKGWREVGMVHGWENLDHYPLTFNTRAGIATYLKERGVN